MEDVTDDANDVNDDAHDDSYDDIEDDDDVDDDDDDDEESASPEIEAANSEISTLGIADRETSHRDALINEASRCDEKCDAADKLFQKDIHIFDASEMINNNCIVQNTEIQQIDNLNDESDAKLQEENITLDENAQSDAKESKNSPIKPDNDNDSDNFNSVSPQCDASSDEPLTSDHSSSDNSTSDDSKSDDDVTFSDAMLKDQSVSIELTKESESETELSQPRFEPGSPREEESDDSPRFLFPSKSGSEPKRPIARTRTSDSFSMTSHLPPLTNRRFSQDKTKESR